MPWRNLPEWLAHAPEWLQWMVGFLSMLGAAGVGAMAKIADDVKTGNRDRFWTKKLFLEVPAVVMMALIGWGLAEYLGIGAGPAAALGAILGWGGPKTVEAIIAMKLSGRWRK